MQEPLDRETHAVLHRTLIVWSALRCAKELCENNIYGTYSINCTRSICNMLSFCRIYSMRSIYIYIYIYIYI